MKDSIGQLLTIYMYLYPLFLQSFLEACKTGNVGVVQLALEGGADPNQADEVMINVCRVVVSHDGVTVH